MSQFDKEITLLDSSFNVYGDPIKAFESLAYSDAWDKHGTISLVLEMDYFTSISGASWIEVDGRVYEIETIDSEDSGKTVKVTGCSLNVLFDRIVITAKERLQGRLEERIRYLVNKYAITGTQAVTGLELGTDNGYARAMDATTTQWQTLSEFLYVQMNQRGFSYNITCDCTTGALVFNIIQGLDRTQDQDTNPPVQLSTTAEIEKATYKKSIKDFRNYAIVHDDDETNPQVVEVDLSNGEPKRVLSISGRAVGADDSEATNLYVIVGYNGYIATSTDGQTWTQQTSGTTEDIYSIEYQNGVFIAGIGSGSILTSTNGTSWTTHATGAPSAVEGVTYIDGMFNAYVLFGVGYSYDSSTWYGTGFSTVGKTVNAAAINGKLFAFAGGTGTYKLQKIQSEDGKNWIGEYVDVSGSPDAVLALRTIYYNGILCCSGYWRSGALYKPLTITSTDYGKSHTVNIIESLSGKYFLDMAAGLGVFVAVGQSNVIAWSSDGITWTDVTPSGGTPDYITVTFDGTKFHAYSATTKHHAYSSDGKTWTLTTFTTSATTIDAVVYGTSSHSGNLYQVGVDALQSSIVVEAIDGDVNSELAPVYETDYNIGDVIDTIDPVRGISATKRVYSVDHIIDKNNDFAIVPKLGKDFLTLRQYIAKELKNNGI